MARTFVGSTFDHLYCQVIADTTYDPEYKCKPRGQEIKELIAPTLILTNPRARLLSFKARDANYGFGVGEFLWYWSGRNDLESISYYNKRSAQFSDDGETVNSAYGYRIFKDEYRFDTGGYPRATSYSSQWDACVKELIHDHDSRRAMLIINRAEDNVKASSVGSKDVPCTLSLQFFIRENRLVLHVNMRSNDAVWGLTYDLFSFTLLQEMMLNRLKPHIPGLELGEYIHTAGSLHVYERHFEMASAVVKEYVAPEFQAAAPMEPVSSGEMALLLANEEALRTGKVRQLDEDQFSGGARWMCQQLNQHRRKRDGEPQSG